MPSKQALEEVSISHHGACGDSLEYQVELGHAGSLHRDDLARLWVNECTFCLQASLTDVLMWQDAEILGTR